MMKDDPVETAVIVVAILAGILLAEPLKSFFYWLCQPVMPWIVLLMS